MLELVRFKWNSDIRSKIAKICLPTASFAWRNWIYVRQHFVIVTGRWIEVTLVHKVLFLNTLKRPNNLSSRIYSIYQMTLGSFFILNSRFALLTFSFEHMGA